MAKEKEDYAGYAFVGFIILGSGVGNWFGNVAAGSAIGVGLGFLAAAFMKKKA
jgi:hypothetical protein